MLTPSGRGHSTDNDREPGQKVHNYRSDRWIALKFLSRVSGGFDSATEPGQKVHNYRSGHWIALKFFSRVSGGFDGAREPGQKVHNYRSYRWIALKFFHEFLEAVFDGVAWNRYDRQTASGRGHSTDSPREPGQKVHNYRYDSWIALKFFSRVSRGCFRWSCMESVQNADGVRFGPFHRQR